MVRKWEGDKSIWFEVGGVASLSPVQVRPLFEVPPVHFGPVQFATPL